MSDPKPPSILATADKLVDEAAIDGLAAAAVVKPGEVGVEVVGNHDIGQKGGWTLGGVAKFSNKDRLLALLAKWTPGK